MIEKDESVTSEPKYVGFNQRILATVIDLMLSTIVLLPFARMEPDPRVTDILNRMQSGTISQTEGIQELNHMALTVMVPQAALEFAIAGLVVVLFWVYRSATPGKMLLKMEIVDANTLGKPTKWQYIIRYLGYIPAAIPVGLGFLWIALNKKRQGWHDKMAGTVVVYTDNAAPKALWIAIAVILVLLAAVLVL